MGHILLTKPQPHNVLLTQQKWDGEYILKKIIIQTRDTFLNLHTDTPQMLSGLSVAPRILTGYVRPQNCIG